MALNKSAWEKLISSGFGKNEKFSSRYGHIYDIDLSNLQRQKINVKKRKTKLYKYEGLWYHVRTFFEVLLPVKFTLRKILCFERVEYLQKLYSR